jgi:hypothetical protein
MGRFTVRISPRRLAELLELPREAELVVISGAPFFLENDLALRFVMPEDCPPRTVIHIRDVATTNPPKLDTDQPFVVGEST